VDAGDVLLVIDLQVGLFADGRKFDAADRHRLRD